MNRSEKINYVRTWRNDMFLCSIPNRILRAELALEYFCNLANPFYDRTCVNQQMRMLKLTPEHFHEREGVKYVYGDSNGDPPHRIHVIEKIEVKSGETKRLDLYYIVMGNVYQAATIFQVTQSRVFNCVHLLNESLNEICKRVKINPVNGTYQWVNNERKKTKKRLRKNPREMISPYGRFVDDHIESHMRLVLEKELEDEEEEVVKEEYPQQEFYTKGSV